MRKGWQHMLVCASDGQHTGEKDLPGKRVQGTASSIQPLWFESHDELDPFTWSSKRMTI
jgi:hypothetical protein